MPANGRWDLTWCLQLVKKFPAFHGTRRFITALTSVRHLSLSWASPIQSIYPHSTSWRSILILSTHLRLGLPSGLLPSGFPSKTLYTPPSPHPYTPQNIVKDIKQYQVKRLQHVQRMDTNRIPKQALQYEPKGRRNIRRPRRRWRDQLHLEDQGTRNTPNPSGT